MKRIIKFMLVSAVLITCGSSAYAQQKFGYLNRMDIMTVLVERDSVMTKIQKLEQQYMQQLEIVQVEYNNKVEDLQKNSANYSEGVKQMKNRELSDLQNRYGQLQQMAQEEMESTYQGLVTPISDKLNNAIKKIGNDGGYTAIFDTSSGVMPFYNEKTMTDVTANVKKELGI